jgi:hypothetical protein
MSSKSYTITDSPTKPSEDMSKPIPTFGDTVYNRLNNPLVSLFTLSIRVLQLIFALAAGISYAVELSRGNTSSEYIYSQVVLGVTLIMLIVDATTLRSYRLSFIIESVICVLWLALFGTFYTIFFVSGDIEDPENNNADKHRMKAAVWIDLINFLLWTASALFSTAMCCSGTKAAIHGKLETRRRTRQRRSGDQVETMEEGVLREGSTSRSDERLPLYAEIAAITRRD